MRAAWNIGRVEHRQHTLGKTLTLMLARRGPAFASDWGFHELLQWAARVYGTRTFIEYGQTRISFEEMNRRSNRIARQLRAAGIDRGTGIALMLSNHPRFLELFFAAQKLGAYVVPVNVALLGDGLHYVLEHSEVAALVCDHETITAADAVRARLPRLKHIWVNTAEAADGSALPQDTRDVAELLVPAEHGDEDLQVVPGHDDPSLLLYTSGTTGLPKAVVSTYGNLRVKSIGLLANLLYDDQDKLYTCLPLFHANALLLTVIPAMWVGIPVYLAKRFSASRFWQEVAACGATQFNTVGSMIPVLLKTPPSAADRAHRVKRVISAACPKNAWEPFEARFGVTLWEAYGAVDGGGVAILNTGTAPVGSLGRPAKGTRWRLVTEAGGDAGIGEAGELWVQVGDRADARVRYWKNEKATSEKVVDGWLHTGDLMQKDADGFLYFVGRNTDSMRRRGENVSAYEVEKVVEAYPDVLESAAFGVPSPLGEQDIMVVVVPVEGRTVDAQELQAFLKTRLPKYAMPTYLEVVHELPKTGTHRVIKADLKKRGVTEATLVLGG